MENNTQMKQAVMLSDLPELCLNKILRHLTLKELTNVAETSTFFFDIAVGVFKVKFANVSVKEETSLSFKQLEYFGP